MAITVLSNFLSQQEQEGPYPFTLASPETKASWTSEQKFHPKEFVGKLAHLQFSSQYQQLLSAELQTIYILDAQFCSQDQQCWMLLFSPVSTIDFSQKTVHIDTESEILVSYDGGKTWFTTTFIDEQDISDPEIFQVAREEIIDLPAHLQLISDPLQVKKRTVISENYYMEKSGEVFPAPLPVEQGFRLPDWN